MGFREACLVLAVLLSGCATLEAELEGLGRTFVMVRDQFKDGLYVYKTESQTDELESVSFNLVGGDQVTLNIKALGLSFEYGLGITYQERAVAARTRTVKLNFTVKDFSFLGGGVVRVQVPKSAAEELSRQPDFELTVPEQGTVE